MNEKTRINKYIAHAGTASRREADELIKKGKVRINGKTARLGDLVDQNDEITVDNAHIEKQYLAYYKGRGIITHSPAEHETDIATKIKHDFSLTDVYPVGRLDKDSEGLILLTNDGRITGPILNPDNNHEREYDVTVDKPINATFLRRMEQGVSIEGYHTKTTRIQAKEKNPKRFSLVLTEGKKHQIRRMCASLGFQVQSLKRVRIMHIELGKLKPNQFRKLTNIEKTVLLKKLGL